MQVWMEDEKELERKAEIERYNEEKAEAIETAKKNGKAKRQRADMLFRRIGGGIVLVILAIVFYRWLNL